MIVSSGNYAVILEGCGSSTNSWTTQVKEPPMAALKKKAKIAMAENKTATIRSAGADKPKVIHVVKKGMKYRGAREAWYNLVQQMEGKTETEFVEKAKEQAPSMPKSGIPENPTGWFRFFERTGVIEVK